MANTDVRGTRQRKPRTKKTQVVENPTQVEMVEDLTNTFVEPVEEEQQTIPEPVNEVVEDSPVDETTEATEQLQDIVPEDNVDVVEEDVVLDPTNEGNDTVESTGKDPMPEKQTPTVDNDIVLVKRGEKYFVCKGNKKLTKRPVLLEKAKHIAANYGQPNPEIEH